MYPLDIYEIMAMVDVVVFLYAFIDINQKFYGNIIALGVSSLLSYYIAIASISGTVVVNYASTTTTGGIDMLQDSGLMWFWLLFAIIQTMFTLYLSYDAYIEYSNDKANTEWGYDE
jgi:hypothetical protein